MLLDDINVFLAHAIQLERDAARQYEDLTQMMRTAGNAEVEGLFRRMAEFSRLHLKEAMDRGGFREVPVLAPGEFQWPEGSSPEAAAWPGVDALIDVSTALDLAMDGEQRSVAFYRGVAALATDPEVRRMAGDFADEESQHVADLQRWIDRVSDSRVASS